jgi:hypothetical protein
MLSNRITIFRVKVRVRVRVWIKVRFRDEVRVF